ncbi:methyltransferase domain-containing protein [Arsenicicoccus sp. oral taxon 190]|uniref:methyltransferase domain-containing protein n=1 Tax=Arsenicicoccus sp. oral taxon 190 TaxID=1658671 RepID=UPI00067A0D80|nr:methyltransferase domain-containing protein [Arsenicicoccus sp. oral taxon 190]AKT51864.1 23S rRNA methyltransferase [Arsenicicoccus sp. oral taxon 190]
MQCDYFDAGRCRSCTLMGVPYAPQLADKQRTVEAALAGRVPGSAWHTPHASRESGFRNKAKLVVGGTTAAPTIGILDRGGEGVDLRGCGLYEPGLHQAVLTLAELLPELGLQPYAVPRRQGELKHLLVTHSPTGQLMIRFVLRSTNQLGRLRRGLPALLAALPTTRVVSVNLQPAHAAILEGDDELVLTPEDTLPMPVGGVTLHLGTRSFFQTNTAVAAALYRQAGDWIQAAAPRLLWDLYCGVGGFALNAARRGAVAQVLGIEASAEAIRSARRSAAELGLASADFVTGDATVLAAQADPQPDLVVVNPPRRGIGADLAGWLERSGATSVVYSSCNPTTLARDLDAMPSWRVADARLFDMFPQTDHAEALVRLER